ncbi:MAG: hypothetical protein KDA28_15155, partial [Phycisphaerales bacterium]|nr:hypothetical protein [Phycisphaerales bacterium]
IGLRPITTGSETQVLATVVDISEHKRVERELKALNRALEQKNAEIEQFVYSVSHDLKSPIVSIRGFVGHLCRDIESGRSDRLGEFARYIDTASTTMRRNINELLEMSRVGRVEYELAPVDTTTLVRRVVSELDPHSADVVVEVEDDLPTVIADETQLERAIQNYLCNALRYGRPEAGTQRIRIGGAIVADEARLWVRDNGPGIEEAFASQVFEAFKKLDDDSDGTGMGLAIVKRIAERHGGRVWVDPGMGTGCTFWIALPAETVPTETAT